MQVYERTENGSTVQVSVAEGLAVINRAMMEGKRDVRTMSASRSGDAQIEYKDGRKVTFRRVEVEIEAPEDAYSVDGTIKLLRPVPFARLEALVEDGRFHVAPCSLGELKRPFVLRTKWVLVPDTECGFDGQGRPVAIKWVTVIDTATREQVTENLTALSARAGEDRRFSGRLYFTHADGRCGHIEPRADDDRPEWTVRAGM